jgi:hypothetical protein
MSDELLKRLRDPDEMTCADGMEAADRIEALTAEREWFEESWVYAADKLAKAMSRAKRVTSFEDTTEELAECGCARCKAHLKLRALLAEIEGAKG